METQKPHPFAGAWEGPWEGRNPFWMYPLQGQAWLQIETDGAVAAEIQHQPRRRAVALAWTDAGHRGDRAGGAAFRKR